MASPTVYKITSCLILISQCHGWISNIIPRTATGVCQSSGDQNDAPLKDPDTSYGGMQRMAFWDESYRQALDQLDNTDANDISWSCGWSDLQPFFSEFVPEKNSRILIPGIGNDGCIRDMFESGYHRLSTFDYYVDNVYAPEGVERAKRITQVICRELLPSHESSSFEVVFDKGTLDSIYLSYGRDERLARKHLRMAISELARILQPGGIVFCVAAACTYAIQNSFDESNSKDQVWEQLRDDKLYMTEDGYVSNNVDATIMVWKRL